MKCQQQRLPSTRKLQITKGDDEDHTIPNPDESTAPKPRKIRDMYIKIHNASETMHIDQPGRFPATSSNGNQYIMVLVEVDGIYIDAEPMKNKSAGSMVKTYTELWTRLTAKGVV